MDVECHQNQEPLIYFKGADINNGEMTIIYDLHLKVYPSDFIYIIGKVGTGKTSIIRSIIAENKITNGEAYTCGYFLNKIKNKEIPYLRRKIGVIFQDFQLLMDRSIEDNLSFVLKATGWKNSEDIKDRIKSVLEEVNLSHKAHKMPHQLSGGEQQRVAIARALLNYPKIIIADEPTGNLDKETSDGIMQLLTKINKEGTAIIMVTHNQTLLEQYPAKVYVCENEGCRESKND